MGEESQTGRKKEKIDGKQSFAWGRQSKVENGQILRLKYKEIHNVFQEERHFLVRSMV